MKRMKAIFSIILAALLLVLPASTAIGSRGHAVAQRGNITIQSWVYGTSAATGLSATIEASFKIKGALVDQGGNPTWTDSTYLAGTTVKDFAGKAGNWQPSAGVLMVPPVKGSTLTTAYAVWHMTAQKGEIFLQVSGTYDAKMQGSGTWVITGGTGAYQGVMGEGKFTADASRVLQGVPYHAITMIGQVWQLSSE